ncbi:MAG TPA: FAD:protein FMN transferase [Chloroflexota bacterium]|nr:FAD:protein FMN transferase [Chloroflexota bacterium]
MATSAISGGARLHQASIVAMDTIVTASAVSDEADEAVQSKLEQALGWFREVERICSRFDPGSEVFRLSSHVGRPVAVSPLLFEAVQFGCVLSEATDGLFDPTVGGAQVERGFNRNYATGERVNAPSAGEPASWRDLVLDAERRTITLMKPLLIDLGAVAKGMAVDLAAWELSDLGSYAVNAGGDIYAKGRNEDGEPWRIGIDHPRAEGILCTLAVSDGAVCSSGDYLRPAKDAGEHHLLDPRSGRSARQAIACTVVAPTAMLADALSTAAFIAGPDCGLRLLEEQGVDGLIVTPDLGTRMTSGFERWLA